MIKKLYLATRNENKLREFRELLGDTISVNSVYEVADKSIAVKEEGLTLIDNAKAKAEAFSSLIDGFVIADDSGIFVDILNGRPGVYSARYAGEKANDNDNITKLLTELDGIPAQKRTAYFECVIALAKNGKTIKTFNGIIRGYIGDKKKGDFGFGYDPIFYIDNKSFAELPPNVKNSISHRYKAAVKLKKFLEEYNNNEYNNE
ncbi:MAG: RdgB/HAM1 family non-canonical purine NTP pyrophosphatase [Deferribacterota bacterium]|nr:RdgB/HAM1 family non-canonical purine NTP pyrophosphatase [Deferribacterota bacterium]